jgi:hypothetical protein
VAEETLVKEALTEEMKNAGAELTRKLDEARWPVVAAFWYFVPSDNQWKLIFASPKLESEGPKRSYEAIIKAGSALSQQFGGLGSISVVAPSHYVVRALASAVATDATIKGIRFSKGMLDGHFIDDAYIYRLAPETAAA